MCCDPYGTLQRQRQRQENRRSPQKGRASRDRKDRRRASRCEVVALRRNSWLIKMRLVAHRDGPIFFCTRSIGASRCHSSLSHLRELPHAKRTFSGRTLISFARKETATGCTPFRYAGSDNSPSRASRGYTDAALVPRRAGALQCVPLSTRTPRLNSRTIGVGTGILLPAPPSEPDGRF